MSGQLEWIVEVAMENNLEYHCRASAVHLVALLVFPLFWSCIFDSPGLPFRDSASGDLPPRGDAAAQVDVLVRQDGAGDLSPAGDLDAGPAWWDPQWSCRQRLTFDNLAGTKDLLGFPVLVRLPSTNPAAGELLPPRFVDADHRTELPYEVERWNTDTRSFFLWVKVPRVDARSDTDHIWMYYCNPADAGQSAAPAVWSAGYVGVWHLEQSMTDSTGNANHASDHGSTTVAGMAAAGRSFDGGSYLELPQSGTLQTSRHTVELWLKSPQSWDDNYWPGSATLITNASPEPCSRDWMIVGGRAGEDAGDAGRVILGVGNCSGEEDLTLSSAPGMNDDKWHHLAWTRTAGGQSRLYLDGALAGTMDDDGGDFLHPRGIQIGGEAFHDSGSYLDGRVDEVRISNDTRSESWIRATVQSMSDQLISFGLEERYSGR